MKDYRKRYIRILTIFVAAGIGFLGIWHQSEMRVASMKLQMTKTEARTFYQFSEAARAVYTLKETGADAGEIAAQIRIAGNFLAGLPISSNAKELIYNSLQPAVSQDWRDVLLGEMVTLFKTKTYAENTNEEKSLAIEEICNRIKPAENTDVENKMPPNFILTDEMRQSIAGVFEDNENFAMAESGEDTVYFYHTNRYLTMYAPLRTPYFYAFGCSVGKSIMDREACLKNAVVFLQRTLPAAFRGTGVPKEAGEEAKQFREGCCFFLLTYPAYADTPITVGVRRDTGSVVFMDAAGLLNRKIEDNSQKVIE